MTYFEKLLIACKTKKLGRLTWSCTLEGRQPQPGNGRPSGPSGQGASRPGTPCSPRSPLSPLRPRLPAGPCGAHRRLVSTSYDASLMLCCRFTYSFFVIYTCEYKDIHILL
ncbi:unnamed protein product, partial [Brenthis ino]